MFCRHPKGAGIQDVRPNAGRRYDFRSRPPDSQRGVHGKLPLLRENRARIIEPSANQWRRVGTYGVLEIF